MFISFAVHSPPSAFGVIYYFFCLSLQFSLSRVSLLRAVAIDDPREAG